MGRVPTSICLAALLMASAALSGRDPCILSLRVTNCYGHVMRIALGRSTLCADARIAQHADHRWVQVAWAHVERSAPSSLFRADDDLERPDPFGLDAEHPELGSIGSSGQSLNGADESRFFQRTMPDLAGGTYGVEMWVYGDTDRRQVLDRAQTTVLVRGF